MRAIRPKHEPERSSAPQHVMPVHFSPSLTDGLATELDRKRYPVTMILGIYASSTGKMAGQLSG
jgi:hypothetical protein